MLCCVHTSTKKSRTHRMKQMLRRFNKPKKLNLIKNWFNLFCSRNDNLLKLNHDWIHRIDREQPFLTCQNKDVIKTEWCGVKGLISDIGCLTRPQAAGGRTKKMKWRMIPLSPPPSLPFCISLLPFTLRPSGY